MGFLIYFSFTIKIQSKNLSKISITFEINVFLLYFYKDSNSKWTNIIVEKEIMDNGFYE